MRRAERIPTGHGRPVLLHRLHALLITGVVFQPLDAVCVARPRGWISVEPVFSGLCKRAGDEW